MGRGSGGGGRSMAIRSGGHSVTVKTGDTINMYLRGGASRRGVVTDINRSRGTMYVRSGRGSTRAAETNPRSQPHRSSGWYKPIVSRSGNVYVKE